MTMSAIALWVVLSFTLSLVTVVSLEVVASKFWRHQWESRSVTGPLDGERIRLARLVLPVILGTLAGWAYDGHGSVTLAVVVAASGWLAAVAVTTDLSSRRIPKEACWAVLGIGAVGVAFEHDPSGIAAAVLAFFLVAVITVTVAMASRGGLGSGDVRMLLSFTPLAAWVGFSPFLWGILFACVLQIPIRLILSRVSRHEGPGVPFAPALILGLTLAVAILGHPGAPAAEFAGILL